MTMACLTRQEKPNQGEFWIPTNQKSFIKVVTPWLEVLKSEKVRG